MEPLEETPPGTSIRLFGGLQVVVDGRTVAAPAGTPGAVLRLVATLGAVHLDELCEFIWPESPAGSGRTRLRNVLSRLRSSCGDVLVRVGDGVAVADGVTVDLAQFQSDARRCLNLPMDDPLRTVLCKNALEMSEQPLLPEDVYREWAAAPRERVRRYRLQLIDALAQSAARAGDITEALHRLEEAIAADPYDESRHLFAANLLLSAGRHGPAHRLLNEAEQALAELGLGPTPELQRLRRQLRDGAPAGE